MAVSAQMKRLDLARTGSWNIQARQKRSRWVNLAVANSMSGIVSSVAPAEDHSVYAV